MEITEPGVYDLPAEIYHGDPVPGGSLSSGGARKLLPPSCPAKFRWWADHGQDPKPEFDFGHAAHLEVLGAGIPVQVIDVDDWRTKAAKEQLATARAAGLTPVKTEQWETVLAMAAALREHPEASALFEPGTGLAEQSLFWPDGEFGVWRRARPDWLPHWRRHDGTMVIPDYKTCVSANPPDLEKAMVAHGYDQQAAWYLDAVTAVLGESQVEFVFVFQEKTPPYVVSVMVPDIVAVRRGRLRNRLALALFRECRERGVWPGYIEGVGSLLLPRWVENEFDAEVERGVYDVAASASA